MGTTASCFQRSVFQRNIYESVPVGWNATIISTEILVCMKFIWLIYLETDYYEKSSNQVGFEIASICS